VFEVNLLLPAVTQALLNSALCCCCCCLSCRAGTGLGVFEVDLLLQREYGYGLDGSCAAAAGA
jgi:hypothetical protein